MADNTIDSLRIDVVESGTENATEKLQNLLKTLRAIKKVSSSKGSEKASFENTADAASAIDSAGIVKLQRLTQSIKTLSDASKQKISSSVASSITRIGEAVDGLKNIDMSKLTEMTAGIKALRDSNPVNIRITAPKADTRGMTATDTVSTALDVDPNMSGMTSFTSEVRKAGSDVEKLNTQLDETQKIAENLKLNESFSEVDKKISKADSSTKQFFGSIARIAKYRLIRSALSAVAKSLKEGIDNLYQYDKISNGTFSKSMNSIATDSLHLKNSLATVAVPLINSLAPAIDFIVDKWVELNNAVSQFIARVTGQKTWKKAIRYPTEYADATDKATAANEKLKRSILGIDELNVLTDNSTASSGSGGGSSNNYKEMFEDVALDDNVSDFIKNLAITVGDVFFDWSDLTGEQIAEKIIVGLGGLLGAVAGFSFGGVPGAIVGSIVGVTLSTIFASLLFDHDGQISSKEVGKMILAAANGLMGAIVGFSLGGVPGAIIGTAIGCGLSLLFSKLLFKDDNKMSSEEICSMVIQVVGGLVGTIAGFAIGGKVGALIGTLTGNGLSLLFSKLTFDNNGKLSKEEICSMVIGVLGSIAGAAIGFSIGGPAGAIVGTVAGVALSLGINSILFKTDENTGEKEVREWVDKFLELVDVKEVWINFKANVSDLWTTAVDLWDDLKEGTKELKLKTSTVISEVWNNAVENWNDLKETTKTLSVEFKSLASQAWEKAVDFYNDLKDKNVSVSFGIGRFSVADIEKFSNDLYEDVQKIWNNVIDWITEKFPAFNFLSKLKFPEKEECEKIGAGISENVVSGVKKKGFSGIPTAITASITSKGALSGYTTSGSTVSSKINSGITFSSIVSKITGALGTKDAKTGYKSSGNTIASYVKSGIAFTGLYSKITGSLGSKDAKTSYQSSGKSAASSFGSGFKGVSFSSLYSTVKNTLYGKSTDYQGSGKSAAGSFKTGFQNTLNKSTFKVKVDLTADQAKVLNASGNIHISASGKTHGGGGNTFAEGGYPPMGDIFIANEAGPELVGRIGRRTAVANQDQIVASVSSGVSQGVYEANAQQNALLREQNELLRKLLAKDTTATISTGQITSALDRANRRNGKVTVPVG